MRWSFFVSWTIFHVFMDNYFTSYRLLVHVGEYEIRETGILNKKKPNNCTIKGNKALEKAPRNHVDQQKSNNWGVSGITVTGWNDSCTLYITSNSLPSQHTKLVHRWNSIDRKYIQVPKPNQFHCYNQGMGLVGQIDQNVAKYHIMIRMKKWWWAPFSCMLDVSVHNG